VVRRGTELLLYKYINDSDLKDVIDKSLAGEELDRSDGITLFNTNNLLALGALADELRKRTVGDIVTFALNRHINYTNVCISKCSFCAYYREKGQAGSYTMSIDEILKKVEGSVKKGIKDFHIVGSHHPDLPFEFYEEMVKMIKKKFPEVHIQAFTAAEINYFSEISGLSTKEVLQRLKDAGLGSMPGGGAEILNEELRKKICPNKVSAEGWIKIMKEAHLLGIKSNATMLFGHLESKEDRVDHLLWLRKAQKETNGFQAFIPLPFHPKNTPLLKDGLVSEEGPSGFDILRTIAISRIMLNDYITNIKAYWVMLGEKLAQISLHYGANDLEGTVVEERITKAAGGIAGGMMTEKKLLALIRNAGRIPALRTSVHEILRVYRE
jgi:aminodeoxyfutalosine synthase